MAKKKYPSRSETGEPLAKDNLQLINGVGPAVEKRLNGIGIYTFPQLAALSPADIAAAIADFSGLSTERIMKQDWIGQARKLAAGENAVPDELPAPTGTTLSALSSPESEVSVTSSAQQHRPVTFTVEFLLDENNTVDSTHILHIQSGCEDNWAGWQKNQLIDFLIESAGLHVSPDESAIPTAEETMNAEEIETVTSEKPVVTPDKVAESGPSSPIASLSRLSGVLHLREMEVMGVELGSFPRTLAQNEPFDVQLTLDLTELEMPENTRLNYKTTIYGRGQGGPGLVVGKSEGIIISTDKAAIMVKGNTLPEGIYRLAAKVTVRRTDSEQTTKSSTSGVIDGGVVQVY